jgi:hypothetical protein
MMKLGLMGISNPRGFSPCNFSYFGSGSGINVDIIFRMRKFG